MDGIALEPLPELYLISYGIYTCVRKGKSVLAEPAANYPVNSVFKNVADPNCSTASRARFDLFLATEPIGLLLDFFGELRQNRPSPGLVRGTPLT